MSLTINIVAPILEYQYLYFSILIFYFTWCPQWYYVDIYIGAYLLCYVICVYNMNIFILHVMAHNTFLSRLIIPLLSYPIISYPILSYLMLSWQWWTTCSLLVYASWPCDSRWNISPGGQNWASGGAYTNIKCQLIKICY